MQLALYSDALYLQASTLHLIFHCSHLHIVDLSEFIPQLIRMLKVVGDLGVQSAREMGDIHEQRGPG